MSLTETRAEQDPNTRVQWEADLNALVLAERWLMLGVPPVDPDTGETKPVSTLPVTYTVTERGGSICVVEMKFKGDRELGGIAVGDAFALTGPFDRLHVTAAEPEPRVSLSHGRARPRCLGCSDVDRLNQQHELTVNSRTFLTGLGLVLFSVVNKQVRAHAQVVD